MFYETKIIEAIFNVFLLSLDCFGGEPHPIASILFLEMFCILVS